MIRTEIKLTYESLIALLQGKDFHLLTPEYHVVFHPPFEGVFLTHQEIHEIQFNAGGGLYKRIEKLQSYEEERDNQPKGGY